MGKGLLVRKRYWPVWNNWKTVEKTPQRRPKNT